MASAMSPDASLRESVSRYFRHLPQRRRRQGVFVIGAMLVGALAEAATLGALLPFLAIIGNPNAINDYPLLADVARFLGFDPGGGYLVPAAVIFSIMAILAGAVRLSLAWVTQSYVYRLGFDLSVRVYTRTLYQPYAAHVRQNTSEVIAGINKVQLVISNMIMPIMQGTTAAIIALVILSALMAIDPVAATVAGLGLGSIYVWVGVATKRQLRGNSHVVAATQTQRVQTIQEGLGGIRDVIVDQAQPIYLAKYSKLDRALRDAQQRSAFIGAAPRFVIEAFGMVLIAMLALVMSMRDGGLLGALPVLGALALGAQRLMPLLQQVYVGWSQMMANRQVFLDVLKLLEVEDQLDKLPHGAPPLPFADRIEIDRVSFRYAPDAPEVLHDVSLAIRRGERIGFIGKTGSGKSTLTDLVMGLLEPTRGAIRVDGTPLTPANWAAWQRQIAHVPQAIYLADATIAENIAFGATPEAIDMERVRRAAAQANIAGFIDGLPLGYDTMVGERGTRLSGGQRQRVGIARALYKQASVLVFDEATSALDDATEAAVMEAIDGLGPELTVIMIAHRLSTVRNCDHVYRLGGGRLLADEAAPLHPAAGDR